MIRILGIFRKEVMRKSRHVAFTLAEMMVVMLIMSIILAAMAPVVTTRNKIDNSSPWRYSPQNASNAYFGAGQAMHALIGQVEATENDNGKLVINTLGSTMSHILFKSNNDVLGGLYLSGSSIVLGNRRNDSLAIGNENINIGHENWSNALEGSSNITIGDNSMQALTTGSNNIGIGTTLSNVSTGSNNVAVGDNSLITTTGSENIAVGSSALGAANGTSSGNVAIGNNANNINNTMTATIAIGRSASTIGLGSIAIGSNLTAAEFGSAVDAANASQPSSVAIGTGAKAQATTEITGNAVAVGAKAQATNANSIAIGVSSTATNGAVAVGGIAVASTNNTVALGYNANSTGTSATALGSNSTASGSGAIAIGISARSTSDDSIAIGRSLANWNDAIAIGNNATANWRDTIAIGRDATADDADNIAIGRSAFANTNNAIAIGRSANANTDSAIAIGRNANADGRNNIAIGRSACANVTGSNKICIGANSGPASADSWARDDVERVFIGGKSNFNGGPAVLEVHNGSDTRRYRENNTSRETAVVVNGNLIVKGYVFSTLWTKDGADTIAFYGHDGDQMEYFNPRGGSNDYAPYFATEMHGRFYNPHYGRTPVYSDRRLKYVGKENVSGLDKIRQLKVFNYTFKKDKAKEPHVGVIAQDLQKVFPNAVKKGADGFLTIRMEDMFYAVINAIKELDAKYQAQEKRIDALEKRIEKLEANKAK